jgi:hypothetical protein
LKKGYALITNPCPGCGDLDGCIEFKDKGGKVLDSITPNCLKAVEEG